MPAINKADLPNLTPGQLEAIAKVLGDRDAGLTATEIDHALRQCGVPDRGPNSPKWMRIYNALAAKVNSDGHSGAVLAFIRQSMDPARYVGRAGVFANRRKQLNVPLAMVGLAYDESGRFVRVAAARTLREAERRASELRAKLQGRDVHPEVLRFCRAELVEDNYYHAVLEATKSIGERIRAATGLSSDGAILVDGSLAGTTPLLRINPLRSESEWSEQRGFANLLKGMYGLFRNTTAHAPRIAWPLSEEDALDLLALASYAHRRLDRATAGGRR